MISCITNTVTLAIIATFKNKSKLLWQMIDKKHKFANEVARRYNDKIYPLFTHNKINLIELAYDKNQFDVFENLIKTTENTRERYSYGECLLRKALLEDSDFDKIENIVHTISTTCKNGRQINQLIHPCNIIGLYNPNMPSLYLIYEPTKDIIRRPTGEIEDYISDETYNNTVEYLVRMLVKYELINKSAQLYEIFKFACCYNKNLVAEIVYNIAEENNLSFANDFGMDNVFVELCGSQYIDLFMVQWFYGTFIAKDLSYDMNTMFAKALHHLFIRGVDDAKSIVWLLNVADDTSISINLKNGDSEDDYLIVKDIIYRNPQMFEWYLNICTKRDTYVSLEEIGCEVIDKCVNDINYTSLYYFLKEVISRVNHDVVDQMLAHDCYKLERTLFNETVKLYIKVINENKELFDERIKEIQRIAELIYDADKRPDVKKYVDIRNEYYNILQIKLTNPELEIDEIKFDECEICQSKHNLLLVQNSLTKKHSVHCVNCNQRLSNRTTCLNKLIVNSKMDFDDDYAKYETWNNSLYDITYQLIVGRFKGKDFNSIDDKTKLLFP